jgi:hypothetical protein
MVLSMEATHSSIFLASVPLALPVLRRPVQKLATREHRRRYAPTLVNFGHDHREQVHQDNGYLRDLIASLQRDKPNYHVLPIWFFPADVDAEQKAVAAGEARDLREHQEMEQKRKDDQLRADIEKRQTGAERRQREEKHINRYKIAHKFSSKWFGNK